MAPILKCHACLKNQMMDKVPDKKILSVISVMLCVLFWISWPLKMGPISCPKTSVTNYHCMVHNISEERGSHTKKWRCRAWCGSVWSGLVWLRMVRLVVAPHGLAWCGSAWSGLAFHVRISDDLTYLSSNFKEKSSSCVWVITVNFPLCATCPAHLIVLCLSNYGKFPLTCHMSCPSHCPWFDYWHNILVSNTDREASYYVDFPSHLLLPPAEASSYLSAPCSWTFTQNNKEVLGVAGISILYKRATKEPPSLFSFMAPFSTDVWLCIFSVYMGVSLLLWIMGRFVSCFLN